MTIQCSSCGGFCGKRCQRENIKMESSHPSKGEHMTREELITISRESGLEYYGLGKDRERFIAHITRFAKLVRADEFEKCAKLCDARVMGDNNREDMEAKRCAADIRSFRARANKT